MSPVGEARERLFAGVPIPERVSREIAAQLPDPLPGRPIPQSKWHFTLRFLGSTAPDLSRQFLESFRGASFGRAFDLRLEGLGGFPGIHRARVLWIGTSQGASELGEIAQRIDALAVREGFAPETRQFNAHLTISRIEPPRSIDAIVRDGSKIRASMRVEEVILFRSHLGGGPSRYEELARVTLDR